MLRTILWMLTAVLITLLLLPLILILKLISLFKPDGLLPGPIFLLIRVLVPLMEKIAGIRFDVTGEENLPERAAADDADGATPAMFVGNHQGAFDALVPLIHIGKTKSVVLKKEIAKVPLAGWILNMFGCIFLDRASLKAQVSCINEMEARLKAGSSLAVFPEGTRSRGPNLGEYKGGAFRAAIAAGVAVVPFVIDGSWRCFEEKGRITPGTIRLSILPPVQTAGLSTKDAKALAAQVQDQTRQELLRLRAES